ncbi:hypothetical protein HZC32_01005 [Candidatus Woesearchaeota archaeon]|nr:hypothetical protein [Candidatus Woesearchaeota archaeon]
MYAKPFTQGKLTIISGPVHSEKTEEIEVFLDALVDSGYKNDGNAVTFRHPKDDPNPEYVGKHKVRVTEKVSDIYESISPHTRTVIIIGASHFPSSGIVNLVDSVVRSNRDIIASGLNLDAQGSPHGHMSELMALADEVRLTKAICSYPACRDDRANYSASGGGYFFPVCTTHYYHPNIDRAEAGHLEIFVGPMFSGKSTAMKRRIRKVAHKNNPYVVFKWNQDNRYGEKSGEAFELGKATLHSEDGIRAVMAQTPYDLTNYLSKHLLVRTIFINELHFFPGIYTAVTELLSQGYQIYGDGLPRGFNRQPFNDVPKLMCLADVVNMHYAICVECGHPATDNQRMKKLGESRVPAEYNDDLIMPGGVENYEARCLQHWTLPGEPELKYKLPRFEWR